MQSENHPPPPGIGPTLDERIPVMSDAELKILLRNATRIARDDKNPKQAKALETLPSIEAEVARRIEEAAAESEQKKARQKKKRATARKKVEAVVEEAEVDDADD